MPAQANCIAVYEKSLAYVVIGETKGLLKPLINCSLRVHVNVSLITEKTNLTP